MHPLLTLPTGSLAELATQLEVAARTPNPLRQRFDTYLGKRNGIMFQFSKATVAFVSTAKQNGLQAASGGTEYLPLTFDELKWHKVTIPELFSDAGLAFSLSDLYEARALTSMEQLVALGVQSADIMGPYESKARQARLNPTVLKACFGDAGIMALQGFPFKLGAGNIIRDYAVSLAPTDFAALSLSFDREPMLTRPDLIAAMRERYVAVFRRYPLAEWQTNAHLNDRYLAGMYSLPVSGSFESRVASAKKAIWPTAVK